MITFVPLHGCLSISGREEAGQYVRGATDKGEYINWRVKKGCKRTAASEASEAAGWKVVACIVSNCIHCIHHQTRHDNGLESSEDPRSGMLQFFGEHKRESTAQR